jgi:hypothetical protein
MKHKYKLLIVLFSLLCLNACKKSSTAPQNSSVAILGKWYITSHTSKVSHNGALIDSLYSTSFNTNDFVEYFNDGTGIISSDASPAPSLGIFTYTIKGSVIVQVNSAEVAGVTETITTLTANNLAVHYVILVTDPNTGEADNEADDYSFKR